MSNFIFVFHQLYRASVGCVVIIIMTAAKNNCNLDSRVKSRLDERRKRKIGERF